MRAPIRTGLAIAALVLVLLPFALAVTQSTRAAAQSSRAPTNPGAIVTAWGVGGVLTKDGTLWQYRPEARRWVTIDQSFKLDNEKRSVMPLPVAASEIASMQGFGFIVTKSGTAWIYDLDANRWKNIGRPGS